MARKNLVFLVVLIVFSTLFSSIQGRKLMFQVQKQSINKEASPSLADKSLYLTSLPKGKVPASTPTKKGHADTTEEKLIARHLAAIDRILRSVPSPGVGH